ncbi:MAG TPA: type IV secretion system protein, partial [Acidobacteriaceae bacterium]|nr:type IV secretion system protein [Acidobacteriaceae bacterium]
ILITTFALNASNYSQWVVGTLQGLQQGITAAFSSTDAHANVYQTLDQTLDKGLSIAADLQQKASGRGITEMGTAISEEINAAIVALSTLLIMLPAGAMIIIANADLTLMLGIGPLFIICLMWPPTAKFFDSWFGMVLNYILRIALLSAVSAFAVAAFSAYTSSVNPAGDQNTLFTALSMAVMAGILTWLLHETNNIASALAGGMSSVAVTFRDLAAPVVGGVRLTKGTGNMLNPVSTRRDLQSGMMSTGTRLDHLMAGNTMANPAYRQALRDNIGRNWGGKRGGRVTGS